MNKKVKIMLVIAVLTATTLHAADSSAGTSEDPLVTKSYVDKKIAALGTGGEASGDVAEQVKLQQELIDTLISQVNALKEQGNTYHVVTVPEGKMIVGGQGSEMIIRAGEGKVIASPAGGLQDMTAGVDIESGSMAPKYHLLIIPREDGRGLLAAKTLTVMVRGGYTVQ
ncbi:MAG: hypothetical protein K0S30_51 [Clostridia bacterium]|jgi:hypothetical protein|nr:hypothetical protein [Clostridia bacterium]